MPPLLLYAVLLFTIAMVLYTISVWGGRLQRHLKPWHLTLFAAGVTTDVIATWLTIEFVGSIVFTPHAIFGFISLFLMVLHLIWAIIVYAGDNRAGQKHFHRFSLMVWTVWMISYVTGFVTGLQRIS